MARYNFQWTKVLVWACTVCAVLALFLLGLARMWCQSESDEEPSFTIDSEEISGTESVPVIEFELWKKKKFARLPNTFWQSHLSGDAFWNKHQAVIDYHFNPLLSHHDGDIDVDSPFYESLLPQSFSEVSEFVGTMQLPEMLQDFVSSMHRRDYSTLIQPNGLCGAGATDEKEAPLLLLAIKSTDLHFENRQAIRETWGQAGWVSGQNRKRKGSGGYVRRIFLMASNGQPPSSELLAESELYGDILQWDFKDTFFNLSLKDVLLWKWFSRYCSKTRFVFKGDDDVFVNTVKTITYLRDQLQRPQAEKSMKTFMVGYVIGGTSPIRDDSSKYFIPENFYTGVFPAYPCGGGFLYSGVLAKRLYQVSKRVHLFPIDDAFVGMCMIRLNIFPIHHPAFLIYGFPGKDEEAMCSYHTMLMIHKRSPSEMTDLWARVRKTEEECWDAPLRNVYIAQHL
ncbi:N-acetyllactosaminide beta-1,3-N-acetylglucosaminyltransferase 2-like [Solea solea]|uniref:N-acetyllactosaminide beta-1,3-N-acetylglucosaminyltransferase 2-like n=1 Tax=Solea solea TaxID=90069 RepID=UPI00272B351E|nr:N-acetyllactosaminide beta-1,3-N-acetylglucosaminyltransferase 2-like [Solea solea]